MKYSFEDLECLIQLNKDGSFTKAAQNLYLTQPVLSRKLRRFEKETGIKVFKRNTHRLELTQEGQIVLHQAEAIISQRDVLNESIRLLTQKETAVIRIGYGSLSEFEWIERLTALMSQRGMGVRIVPKQYGVLELLDEDLLDAAILNECEIDGADWLDAALLTRAGLSVFMGEGDPIAEQETIDLRDLVDRKLLVPSRKQSDKPLQYRPINHRFHELLIESGIHEACIYDTVGMQSFSLRILGEHMLGILPDTARMSMNSGILRKPVQSLRGGFGTVIAWRRDNESALLCALRDVVSAIVL